MDSEECKGEVTTRLVAEKERRQTNTAVAFSNSTPHGRDRTNEGAAVVTGPSQEGRRGSDSETLLVI